MALTRYQLADKLRTMKQGGSKAPLQNVKLPTNQSSYRTPSMTSTSPGTAEKQAQMGTNPQALAAAGGLLGKIGKGAWDAFNRPESMALDKASSANLGNIGGMLGLLQGSNVDVAANMAGNTASNLANLPQASMLGNGVPVAEGWSGAMANAGELGNLSSVTDAVSNATDAASAATDTAANASSWGIPGGGSLIGAGLSASQGDYGKAAGQAVGGIAGSYFGPLGTMAGSTLGGMIGSLFD